MPPSRRATPVAGAIALVLVGGAVATGVAAFMTYVRIYQSPTLLSVRVSTGYYALECLLVGVVTGAVTLLARPRDPITPIVAAISGYIALYVGQRFSVILYPTAQGAGMPDMTDIRAVIKPHFESWDMLAVLAAGAIAGLRVAMVSSSLGRSQPTPGFGAQPGFGNQPGYGNQPGHGVQPPAYGRPPAAGQPPAYGGPPAVPGQPSPGQQFPPPGQGGGPGAPQGGAPPYGGV